MHFNERKATAVACYFLEKAGGGLEDLKLMKLMYLSEREMIRLANVSITGDVFFSMQNGPVLSITLELMQGKTTGNIGQVWNEHIDCTEKWKVKLKKATDSNLLSEAEQTIIAAQWHLHGKKNKWKLVDLTHEFPEWDRRAEELKTSFAIPIVDVLKALKLSPENIEARLAQMKAGDHFEDLLAQAESGKPEAFR